VSVGVATAVAPRTAGCELLLEAAQRALEGAKAHGGNRVQAGSAEGSG
jgi:PleD family two-component response regulator